MIQIYGRKKCKTTRKAERFFNERGVEFQSVDLDAKTPGRRELELFASVIGIDAILDSDSKVYRDRGFAYMEFDAIEEIAEDPRLLRTPIVREGRECAVGDDPAFWKRLAERARS
ncbi:MAG: arsenate reductase family protein [Spirochaetota bacterium]